MHSDAADGVRSHRLRTALASAKMRPAPLPIGSLGVPGVSFDDHLDRDDLAVGLPQFHPLVIPGARR